MSISQKDLIIALRNQGLPYKQIAEQTETSEGYCRVVCSQSRQRKAGSKDQDLCKFCGQPIVHTAGAKKRQFCCDQCCDAYHNRKMMRKPYVRICEYCNNEFVSYGYPKKRFCCRECQTLFARKGREGNG